MPSGPLSRAWGPSPACGWRRRGGPPPGSRRTRTEMLSLFGALAERQAGAGSEDDPLSQLVGIIRQHAKPTREDWNERLSDPTLTVCVRALARTITGDWEACRRVVRLGLIGFVRRIFLSDRAERDTSPMCGTEYPALQLALADLLAEVMLSGAGEAMRRHQKLGLGGGRINVGWSMSSSAGFADRPTSREDQPEVLTQISRNVVQSTLIGEAALASEALVESVAAAQARYDHALVWAVLSALRRAAEQPMCCHPGAPPALRPAARAAPPARPLRGLRRAAPAPGRAAAAAAAPGDLARAAGLPPAGGPRAGAVHRDRQGQVAGLVRLAAGAPGAQRAGARPGRGARGGLGGGLGGRFPDVACLRGWRQTPSTASAAEASSC
ncbi:unnamed protein product [Prorocentrum cordatum]|uniref:Uncharacterized protein n=1 Tax=Prorocentrum cordatum TaxID=2364126 RepID=A0ABN9RCN3_9DINO|nr:unnamed protein product [Polarella glacialis]